MSDEGSRCCPSSSGGSEGAARSSPLMRLLGNRLSLRGVRVRGFGRRRFAFDRDRGGLGLGGVLRRFKHAFCNEFRRHRVGVLAGTYHAYRDRDIDTAVDMDHDIGLPRAP